MSKLYHTKKARVKSASNYRTVEVVHLNNDDSTFEDLPLKNVPLIVSASKGDKLLITLTAPDTWNNKKGCGTWFGIEVNDKIIGKGVYFVAEDSQRVPISIQAVYEVDSNKDFEIKGKWATCKGGKSYIGAYSETTLTVLKV